MPESLSELMARIKDLEDNVEEQLAEQRKKFKYHIERRRVVFEADVLRKQKEFKVAFGTFLRETRFLTVLTAPFIYGVAVPLVLLDLVASLYQAVCFPVYGIGTVRRRDYIFLDRSSLAYLNGLQKLNCAYCGYGNGLLAYVTEIAARTEQYWCPIKHAARISGAHARYVNFLEYGDAEGFQEGQKALRKKLAEETLGTEDQK